MREHIVRRIELLANLAIILVAIVSATVFARTFLSTRLEPPDPPADGQSLTRLQPGDNLTINGLEWKGSGRRLVVVLSTTCRFCAESAPFYTRLADAAERSGVQLVAVFAQSIEDSTRFATGVGLGSAQVVQAYPPAFGVQGTPSLILVDEEGRVIAIWQGLLQPEDEAVVLEKITRR